MFKGVVGDFVALGNSKGVCRTGYLQRPLIGDPVVNESPIHINNLLEVFVVFGSDDCAYGVVLHTPIALTTLLPGRLLVHPKLDSDAGQFTPDMRLDKLGLLIYYSARSTIVLSDQVLSPLVSRVNGGQLDQERD